MNSTSILMISITFTLNGIPMKKEAPIGWTLLRFLRDCLGYYGTKCGCEIGECGSCTILYNGQAMNSCLILAAQIDGAEIWTIEGVAPIGSRDIHPIQKAFLDCDAVHCGFCSPGMVMTTISLLLKNQNPSESEIKNELAGNLCRCTGYTQIIEAVKIAITTTGNIDLEKFRPSKSRG
jgi:aerobic carbon-monoxide dehydrogenase small subunit